MLGSVVTDRRFVQNGSAFATAEVVSATYYYSFGMEMPGRIFAGSKYVFGFNAQMKSPEILPGHTTAQFWEYDSRIGRRWELDPVVKENLSGYSVLSNSPIWKVDYFGNDDFYSSTGVFLRSDNLSTRNIYMDGTEGAVGLLVLCNAQVANSNQMEMINTLNRTYSLDLISKNYKVIIDNPVVDKEILSTEGNFEETQFVTLSLCWFEKAVETQKDLNAGILAFAHERIHVGQRSGKNTKLHGKDAHHERELLAYHFTLFPNTTKVLNDTKFIVGSTASFEETTTLQQRAQWVFVASKSINHLMQKNPERALANGQIINDILVEKKKFEEAGYNFDATDGRDFVSKNRKRLLRDNN